MKQTSLTIYAFTILLVLVGCNKVKSDKWIIATVHVYESETGNGTVAKVQMRKTYPGGSSSLTPSVALTVETDEQGYVQIEYKIPKSELSQPISYSFTALHPHYFDSPMAPGDPRFSINSTSLNVQGENSFSLGLEPYVAYQISAINTNCSSASDSVWIEVNNNSGIYVEAYGCADTSYSLGYILDNAIVSDTTDIELNITTKKSGVVNNYTQTYTLNLGYSTQQILVEY